jgi:hypothetical protein
MSRAGRKVTAMSGLRRLITDTRSAEVVLR